MYLQITTLCNMACAHCCYNSRKNEYHHMSLGTVTAALRCYERYPELGWIPRLNIGGGEPTCHPQFWKIFEMSVDFLKERRLPRPWMITNGKLKETALRLARLAKDGEISCGVSEDEWHEPIDPEVIKAFRGAGRNKPTISDGRFIQNIGQPIRIGRCDWGKRIDCACSGRPFVTPDGLVHQCGCIGSPVVGNVHDGFRPMDDCWNCFEGKNHPNDHSQILWNIFDRRYPERSLVPGAVQEITVT